MKHNLLFLVAFLSLGACGKGDAPAPQPAAGQDSHPVKNVEALPSGTIREGAKTMNSAADLSKTMEQQKQDRDKDPDSQNK
ncbi:MAG TPA: hypothetical protein VF523_17940 [Burkholderiales bacterium]